MSSVEDGLCGVWSCLYCEGVWLSVRDAQALVARLAAQPNVGEGKVYSGHPGHGPANWRCPECETRGLLAWTVAGHAAFSCSTCFGLFLPRDVARALVAAMATRPFFASSPPSERRHDPARSLATELVGEVAILLLLSLFS